VSHDTTVNDVPGTLGFSAATYTVNEDAGMVTITVARTLGTLGAVSAQYATSNGTAKAGVNYTATSGMVSLAQGETSKTFTIAIIDDKKVTPNQTVNLTLSSPTGGASLGTSTALLTIKEVDRSKAPGEFDGDGKTDLALYRTTTAQWVILRSTAGGQVSQFGDPSRDIPVPGDYDGDGKVDLAVFRPTTAQWFILNSSGGGAVFQFGQPGVDIPATPPIAFRQTGGFSGSSFSVKGLAVGSVTPSPAPTSPGSIFVGPQGGAIGSSAVSFAVASTPRTPQHSLVDTALESIIGNLTLVAQHAGSNHTHQTRHHRLRPARHHG
jgi:hypothetical protein